LKEKEELEKEIENLKQQLGNMDSSEKVINLESDLKKLRDDYQSLVTQTRLKNAKLIEEQKLTTSLKEKINSSSLELVKLQTEKDELENLKNDYNELFIVNNQGITKAKSIVSRLRGEIDEKKVK